MTDSIANGGCCAGSVRPGTYGNAYDVAQITVDRCGRITKISNVAISGGGGGPQSYLVNNSNYLYLLPDGTLSFPNNEINSGSNSLTVKTQSGSGMTLNWNDGSGDLTEVNLNSGGVNFRVATPSLTSQWYFNPDGSTSMPGNLYVANALTTTNVFASLYYGDGGLLSNIASSGFVQPLPNLVVSNSVTTTNVFASNLYVSNTFQVDTALFANSSTVDMNFNTLTITYINTSNVVVSNLIASKGTINMYGNVSVSNTLTASNVHVTDTLDVVGSMTANVSNATFFFDTFTIPYINTQYLNVASNVTLSGNLSAPLANITTLNVNYLTVNSAVVYGATTLNVYGTSNLTNVLATTMNLTNNLYAANAVTTTNLFVTGNTSSVSNMIVRSFDFVVSSGAGSYSNICSITDSPNGSAIYVFYVDMMTRSTTGNAQTKTYIVSSYYNATGGTWTRALPMSNSVLSPQIALDVNTTNGVTTLRATNVGAAVSVNVGIVLKTSSASFTRVTVTDLTSQTGSGATSSGYYPTTQFTQPFGRVGVSIEQPTANLHVIGNVYASNALQTVNVFATNGVGVGPGVLGSNVFVFSNVSGGSNIMVMNNLGRVGIATTTPGYLLDVGTTVSIPPGNGGETIRSKGPLVIGNGVNDGNRFISALDSSLTAGNARYITFGKAGSLYNQAELAYVHSADNSTNNRMDIGFFSTTVTTFLANGNVGFGTSTPTATLHVIGNVYASNAVTTTNVFVTNGVNVGPGVLGSNVFVFSNVSGGSNVIVMNNIGNIGIATTNPGYPLDVGSTVAIGVVGGETIRSKGAIAIGNGTNDGNRFISALDSSITNNTARYFCVGKAASLNNQGEVSYYHVGDGSSSNKLGLGLYGGAYLYVLGSGNVGIGTGDPTSKLTITGDTGQNGTVQILCAGSGKNGDGMAFKAGSGGDGLNIMNFVNSSGTVRGAIQATSTTVTYASISDRRLKTEITDMPSTIDRIKQLRPCNFVWKESGTKDDGFIAQEVHKVFPQFINGVFGYCDVCHHTANDVYDGSFCECCDFENPVDTDGKPRYYGLDYGKFTPYLTKALQETIEIVEKQAERITELESKLEKVMAWAQTQGMYH